MTAKKKSPNSNSAIPDTPIENPLIIDLPDGQKLVVGKLADGSIIEIATWRGTGRPDSRTSRLMLGMANGQRTQEAKGEAYESKPAPAKSSQEFLQQAKSTFSSLKSRFVPAAQTQAEQLVEKELITPSSEVETRTDTSQFEAKNFAHIQQAGAEYLDRISSRKIIRRQNRIKRDPVAAEIDLWLQKVLRDVQLKMERTDRKKVAKRTTKRAVAKKSQRPPAKKKTPASSKSKKR